MDSKEGITLAKMAVTCLLLVLVIGAIFFIWNMLYTPSIELEQGMTSTVKSTVRDKLMELQDKSNAADGTVSVATPEEVIEAHPLVTQVTHSLNELKDDDLLFVFVCENKNTVTSNGWMFTYPGITYTNTSVLPVAPSNTVDDSDVPTGMAVKHLLQYSENRCHVTVSDVDYGGQSYIGIIVEVLT